MEENVESSRHCDDGQSSNDYQEWRVRDSCGFQFDPQVEFAIEGQVVDKIDEGLFPIKVGKVICQTKQRNQRGTQHEDPASIGWEERPENLKQKDCRREECAD